jgi:hypothetical protein
MSILSISIYSSSPRAKFEVFCKITISASIVAPNYTIWPNLIGFAQTKNLNEFKFLPCSYEVVAYITPI